jgi:hypothetical protein
MSDPTFTENRRFDLSSGQVLCKFLKHLGRKPWHEFRPFDLRKILRIIFRFGPLLCLKQAIGILVNNFGEGLR